MYKLLATIFALVFLSVSSSAEATVRNFRLPNGLSVFIQKDSRFPLVCTRLFVRTGSTNESPKEFGISHVLEHMVFKGTESRPKGQVAKDVEKLGGYLNAYTSYDKTCYLTDMPSSHWKTGIDIVRDMAFSPSLDPEELEKEKPVIISEMEGREDKPAMKLYTMLQEAALKGTAYEHPIIGTRESVRAVTRDSLRAYIQQWYQAQNMLLVVVGNIEPDQVAEYVAKHFGSLPSGKNDLPTFAPIDFSSLQKTPRVVVEQGNFTKVYLGLAFPVPGLKDTESLNLDILSLLLAGDGTSYFERKYRQERRLVDKISVGNSSYSRAGLFLVTAVLDAKNVESFVKELSLDFAKIASLQFTQEELDRAKINIEDELTRSSETLNGLATWRSEVEFEFGGVQGEKNLWTQLKQVSLDDVQKSAQKWLVPERSSLRILLPKDSIDSTRLETIMAQTWPIQEKKKDATNSLTAKEEVLDLGNGRTVVLIPDQTIPYFSAQLLFSGGLSLQQPQDEGLTSLMANCLTTGCGSMDRVAFSKAVSACSASIATKAGLESFSVSLSGPSRNASKIFSLAKEMIENPLFAEKEIANEKQDNLASLLARKDKPIGYLFSKVGPFLFGKKHPYGYDPLGTKENIQRFSRGELVSLWQTQRAMPWVLAVCGQFDKEQVLAWAKSFSVPSKERVNLPQPQMKMGEKLELRLPAKNQAHLLLSFPIVTRDHPDAPALILLESILSGQSGVLFNKLRDEESLGYTVTAFTQFTPKTGMLYFYIGTTADRVEKARHGFDTVIAELKNKLFAPESLRAGSSRLEGEYSRSIQSLGARAGQGATETLLGNNITFQESLIAKTYSVTPEEVQKVAQKYLQSPCEFRLIP